MAISVGDVGWGRSDRNSDPPSSSSTALIGLGMSEPPPPPEVVDELYAPPSLKACDFLSNLEFNPLLHSAGYFPFSLNYLLLSVPGLTGLTELLIF